MSSGAQVTIGVIFGFAAVCFALIGWFLGSELPAGPLPFYFLSAFSGVIVAACFIRRSRALTLRFIGAVIFGAYALYAYDAWGGENFGRALRGFIVIGIPAAYLTITAGYPIWGKYGGAFSTGEDAAAVPAGLTRSDAVRLTPRAADRIREIVTENKLPASTLARVDVRAAGSMSYEYGLRFERTADPAEDMLCESHGIEVVVSQSAVGLLDGTVIDFAEGPEGSGFRFHNPNAREP